MSRYRHTGQDAVNSGHGSCIFLVALRRLPLLACPAVLLNMRLQALLWRLDRVTVNDRLLRDPGPASRNRLPGTIRRLGFSGRPNFGNGLE